MEEVCLENSPKASFHRIHHNKVLARVNSSPGERTLQNLETPPHLMQQKYRTNLNLQA